MPKSLNIVARTNGVGLDRDVELIRRVAEKGGYRVVFSHSRGTSPLHRWLPQKKRFDANIFLERVFPRWLGAAETNLLVPNQERFPQRHVPILQKIDHILCKSHHAQEIFAKVHPSCPFTGFTSSDFYQGKIPRIKQGILHLAGRSTLKGTETILDLWKKHPEWPTLTLVQCAENAPTDAPDNVKLLSHYLEDEEIIRIYNQHPIHLCPSRSEGWGHYIVEAMSCGALVLTTDAPPMNELVQADRGVLVQSAHSEPRHLGINFFVDPAALEEAITNALALPTETMESLGQAARAWTIENEAAFEKRFLTTLEKVLPNSN